VVFDGSPRQPYMPADRLRFSAPVRDVSFVMRDFPKPDANGVGEYGVACDPDPASSGPGTAYRPNSDFTDGARPINLRGMFGFAMLTNGQIAVIDVEDFDAPCRRPVSANMGDYEDLHGCKNDTIAGPFSINGARTVSGESSCKVVETHRPRSAALSISSSSNGLRAPTLRSFPQFTNQNASDLTVAEQPRLLATDIENPDPAKPGTTLPAEVNVSSQLYAHCTPELLAARVPPCDGSATPLVIDPTQPGVQNSLTLPLNEPRSYAQDETLSLGFEGKLFADRKSGFLQFADGATEGSLRDPDANFCGAGVEDSDTIKTSGEDLGIPAANLSAWAAQHADYVQITGNFPADDDPYWRIGRGAQCAALINPNKPTAHGRDACTSAFGNIDNPAVLKPSRDLSVLRAYAGQLDVTPRVCPGGKCDVALQQLACCFPAGTAYTVRASNQWLLAGTGGLHDIAVGPNGRCQHTASCDRRKQYFAQRAFEVCDSSRPDETHTETITDADGNKTEVQVVDFSCAPSDPKVGCVADGSTTDANGMPRASDIPVFPGKAGAQCIFENLTSRFVVYRGLKPTIRGMSFNWQTTGGFIPQAMSLTTLTNSVSPQSLSSLPELGYLAVVDASTLGLVLFNLNSLGIVMPSPYY